MDNKDNSVDGCDNFSINEADVLLIGSVHYMSYMYMYIQKIIDSLFMLHNYYLQYIIHIE